MNRQNLYADSPGESEEYGPETGLRHRTFWRPANARMGATLWDMRPGADGMRWHMHYGAEEMFFVLSGRVLFRTPDGEEELAAGDYASCPEGRAGLHAYSNPFDEPARVLGISAGGFPDVVAYPEHHYAWVATRDPDPDLPTPADPGIIQRFDFTME